MVLKHTGVHPCLMLPIHACALRFVGPPSWLAHETKCARPNREQQFLDLSVPLMGISASQI